MFLEESHVFAEEARRVLKHKGTIIIGFISRDSGWGRLYLKKKAEGHKLYGYANFYSPGEMKEMLKREKFQIKRCIATLLQEPETITYIEEPSNDVRKRGFVCVKAVKI